ncbi:hypothetical protein [Candidatus Laterigemmans baculatus]|uniref:hypothetical protein n=1 Tax=Candidatus Laterigemmans baculatus TaxID=2770505 RepID=UPI0013DC5842|nr:hypothetical protein [Candidatus Laterigemmans baculatus]
MTRCLASLFSSSSIPGPLAALLPLGTLLGLLCVVGCSSESTLPDTPPQDTPGLHDDHDHGHEGHDHEGHSHDELGPHGGHIIVLDPGHYHAEWVHLDEENTVEVYLGELGKSAEKVQFVAELEGKEPVTYELQAADESLGAGGYQLQSPNLLTHIAMSDGTTARVTLVVETADATLKAPLSGDHDHDH